MKVANLASSALVIAFVAAAGYIMMTEQGIPLVPPPVPDPDGLYPDSAFDQF